MPYGYFLALSGRSLSSSRSDVLSMLRASVRYRARVLVPLRMADFITIRDQLTPMLCLRRIRTRFLFPVNSSLTRPTKHSTAADLLRHTITGTDGSALNPRMQNGSSQRSSTATIYRHNRLYSNIQSSRDSQQTSTATATNHILSSLSTPYQADRSLVALHVSTSSSVHRRTVLL